MKKMIGILLLASLVAAPAHAINIFEKTLYRKDVIKRLGAKVLVNPLTGQIKYVWCMSPSTPEGGFWMPATGPMKEQYQASYDHQNTPR